MKLFAQLGLETSFDNYDYISGGNKLSKSEMNVGIAPGVGMELFLNKNTSFFVLGRGHMISDSYFSMQFGLAQHY
jgi:hypothetical protein